MYLFKSFKCQFNIVFNFKFSFKLNRVPKKPGIFEKPRTKKIKAKKTLKNLKI